MAELRDTAQTDSKKKSIDDAALYIQNNWTAARKRMTSDKTVVGCSAEGHVFHVLSRRLSTLPLGWSELGADRMAHLRAYALNDGNMLELAMYQHSAEARETPGQDDVIDVGNFSIRDLFSSEKKGSKYGKYFDSIQATVSDSIRSTEWFKALSGHSLFNSNRW